jgi:aminopeptidase N
MKQALLFFLLAASLASAYSQNTNPIDVQHYRFELTLSDASDTIKGIAGITVSFATPVNTLQLDLTGINPEGKGMQVLQVTEAGKNLSFTHKNNKLGIQFTGAAKPGNARTFTIRYKGIPADGLIIGQSIFKKRTFFGDNWPNRAHHWLPCNDVPIDKASLEFIITAPQHYSVVSNGIKVNEELLPDSTKRTHWKEDVLLPTKVMVIGAADFAVGDAGSVGGIPVNSWVYQEEKDKGFYDYGQAKEILKFFIHYIGPYGYKKLANVQSKTIFGGMENASAIFYFEQSVTGKRTIEDLLAHEIAHQWFGNMVTEKSFNHLWLSEGFATYMTNIYLESQYGPDSMARRMQGERNQVAAFAQNSAMPVIDTTSDYMQLLNANSYQKGGWILHMLRHTVGNDAFHKIIQEYYKRYAGKNANSDDFITLAQEVCRKPLAPMLNQWLRKPGLPVLNISWKYNTARKAVILSVEQTQPVLFSFPLEVLIKTEKGDIFKTVNISAQKSKFTLPSINMATALQFDPGTNLLWAKYEPPAK